MKIFLALVILLSFLTASAGVSSSSCENIFSQDSRLDRPLLDTWRTNAFSNPKTHHPTKYRYLVHTFDTAIRNGHLVESVYKYLTENFVNDSIDILSISLIDQNKNTPFGTVGFILEVPPKNIAAMGPADLGSPVGVQFREILGDAGYAEYFKGFRKNAEQRFISPEKLLTETSLGHHNELVIQGGMGPELKITGVFFTRKPGPNAGSHIDQATRLEVIAAMKTFSAKMNIPFIEL